MKEDGGDEEGGNGLERGVGGDDGRVNVLVAPQLHMMETRCTCHEEVGGDGMDQHVVGRHHRPVTGVAHAEGVPVDEEGGKTKLQ